VRGCVALPRTVVFHPPQHWRNIFVVCLCLVSFLTLHK
jgi:hypothetical protein